MDKYLVTKRGNSRKFVEQKSGMGGRDRIASELEKRALPGALEKTTRFPAGREGASGSER